MRPSLGLLDRIVGRIVQDLRRREAGLGACLDEDTKKDVLVATANWLPAAKC